MSSGETRMVSQNLQLEVPIGLPEKLHESYAGSYASLNEDSSEEKCDPCKSHHGSYGSMDVDSSHENCDKYDVEKFKSQVMSERKFMEEFKASMIDSARLQYFMEMAEFHPPHAWYKVLLLLANTKHPNTTLCLHEDMLNGFIDELLAKFPDVLQRVLLRGAYEKKEQKEFGPLHVAIICQQPKIVDLLTKVEFKEHIKKRLVDCAKQSNDEFKTIERALLWSQIEQSTQSTSHSCALAQFMRKFDLARRSENIALMEDLISNANCHPGDAWRTVLQWASAVGKHYIVRKFKELWPDSFAHIQFTSQKEGFAKIQTKGKDGAPKAKHALYNLVGDLVDTIDEPTYRHLLARNLHSRIGDGWTPLHVASILSKDIMLDTLIDCYNNLHQVWDKSSSKLRAFGSPIKNRKRREKWQEKLNFYYDFSDDNWMSPLHYAILNNDEKIVQRILKWKLFQPYLNDVNLFLCTPFHLASRSQSGSTMLQLLIENPLINVNVEDCCSFSPLHWAVYVQAPRAIRFLLSKAKDAERPMKMNEEDAEGHQAFAIAVKNKSWKLLTSLPEVQQEVEMLYRDRQVYIDAANALLVGAALIAGVTFGGWLAPPLVSSFDVQYMKVFWAFNSLSFFFSIAAVMAGAVAVLPMEDVYIGIAVKNLREWLIFTSFLLIISVIFVLGAFTAAGFCSVHMSIPNLWQNMLVTTIVGCTVCFTVGLMFLQKLYAIFRAWGNIQIQLVISYLRKIVRCIEDGFWTPLTLGNYKNEYKIKEDWTLIGRKWKMRQNDWKRYRGVHHLGYISVASCRKHALEYERSVHDKLVIECQRHHKLGTALAHQYWDLDWTNIHM